MVARCVYVSRVSRLMIECEQSWFLPYVRSHSNTSRPLSFSAHQAQSFITRLLLLLHPLTSIQNSWRNLPVLVLVHAKEPGHPHFILLLCQRAVRRLLRPPRGRHRKDGRDGRIQRLEVDLYTYLMPYPIQIDDETEADHRPLHS